MYGQGRPGTRTQEWTGVWSSAPSAAAEEISLASTVQLAVIHPSQCSTPSGHGGVDEVEALDVLRLDYLLYGRSRQGSRASDGRAGLAFRIGAGLREFACTTPDLHACLRPGGAGPELCCT